MPRAFNQCWKRGGKVRTVTKGGGKGRLICIPSGHGHPVLGEKRKRKRKRK